MRLTAKELAVLLDAQIDGNSEATVSKLVKIEEADKESLCFIANAKYAHYAENTHASILVVSKDFSIKNTNGTTYLRVADPYSSFAVLLEKFNAWNQEEKLGVDSEAKVDDSASLGQGVYIGAFCYIGKNVRIADGVKIYPQSYIGDDVLIAKNTIIHAGVKIYAKCQLGEECIVHSGVVIGSDGFGFAPQADGSFSKVPQTGNVIVGNRVEIGANTVVDRATLGSTFIADGVKLDNLVQVAHNVQIGENSVVAAQAGISGSTKLGKNVMVGGQAGFVGHVQIADRTKINAQSGVSKSITQEGSFVSGSPAEAFRQHYKGIANVRKLEELIKRIEFLEKELGKKA